MEEDSTKELSNNELLRMILTRLDSIEARLDSMETRLDSMETRLDSMDARLTSVETRLTTLEEKVERRLMETRPIWESVLEQLKEVNGRIDRLEIDYKDTRQMFRSGFDLLTRMQQDLNYRLLKVEEPLQPGQ